MLDIFHNYDLFSNIYLNFLNLTNDFTGMSMNPGGIIKVFLSLIFSLISIAAYYMIGEKLSLFLIDISLQKYKHFIFIAIGYIFFGTFIALLGVFSLLYQPILYIIIGLFFLLGIYCVVIKRRFISFTLYSTLSSFGRNKFLYIAILLFVVLGTFRLLLPETAEDSVGYHIDLPILYITKHTTMISQIHPQHVITYPQLAEMHYVIAIFLGLRDATRYLHFIFYILIILLLVQIGRDKPGMFKFSPLLFVATPLVVKYSSTAYTDFFMVFYFFLSTIILIHSKKLSFKKAGLLGVILGGTFAIKLWTLVFLLPCMLYVLYYFKNKKKLALNLFIFITFSLFPSLIWYIRSFILKGNPIYPIFAKPYDVDEALKNVPTIFNYININWNMFSMGNLILFGPLFFIALLSFIFNFKNINKLTKKSPIVIFFIFLTAGHIIFNIAAARYLLAWYVFAVLIGAMGIRYLVLSRIFTLSMWLTVSVLFSYYTLNTLLTLPYAFGWADQNRYLTRILSRDNSSYYDFNKSFDSKISKRDIVVTYGISGFYYANFKYIDINNIYSVKQRPFNLLKKSNATRLLIKGGDFLWFCKKLQIQGCNEENMLLLASFPLDTKKYNLYKIIER